MKIFGGIAKNLCLFNFGKSFKSSPFLLHHRYRHSDVLEKFHAEFHREHVAGREYLESIYYRGGVEEDRCWSILQCASKVLLLEFSHLWGICDMSAFVHVVSCFMFSSVWLAQGPRSGRKDILAWQRGNKAQVHVHQNGQGQKSSSEGTEAPQRLPGSGMCSTGRIWHFPTSSKFSSHIHRFALLLKHDFVFHRLRLSIWKPMWIHVILRQQWSPTVWSQGQWSHPAHALWKEFCTIHRATFMWRKMLRWTWRMRDQASPTAYAVSLYLNSVAFLVDTAAYHSGIFPQMHFFLFRSTKEW